MCQAHGLQPALYQLPVHAILNCVQLTPMRRLSTHCIGVIKNLLSHTIHPA